MKNRRPAFSVGFQPSLKDKVGWQMKEEKK